MSLYRSEYGQDPAGPGTARNAKHLVERICRALRIGSCRGKEAFRGPGNGQGRCCTFGYHLHEANIIACIMPTARAGTNGWLQKIGSKFSEVLRTSKFAGIDAYAGDIGEAG
jgi:hypothetical protein